MTAAVALREVSVWLGVQRVLTDVVLDVAPRSITALVGPAGSGKTTLLRTINRLIERDPATRRTGSVLVDGVDVDGLPTAQLRRQVALVGQHPTLLPRTVRDNVLFGWRLHPHDVPRAEPQALVESTLRAVGLWDAIGGDDARPAHTLTPAEQQLLCIARVLPTGPSVVLLDDPCTLLDDAQTARVEELLWELRERCTVLLATSDLIQARRASDTCAVMVGGAVVEHEDTAQVFVTPADPRTAAWLERAR